jgi:hypothetical protein
MPRMNGQQMVNALDQAVAGSNTHDLPNAKRKKIGLLETPKEWYKDVGRWGITAVDAMKRLKMNRRTFYRRVKELCHT